MSEIISLSVGSKKLKISELEIFATFNFYLDTTNFASGIGKNSLSVVGIRELQVGVSVPTTFFRSKLIYLPTFQEIFSICFHRSKRIQQILFYTTTITTSNFNFTFKNCQQALSVHVFTEAM